MIDLYFWPTPNGQKVSIFLEETATPYNLIPVDIGRGDQHKPEFLAISPNNKMPAIVDHLPRDGGAPIAIFESGAILMYLADKVAQFFPTDPRQRVTVTEWLFWQVGGLGPMLGQAGHFRRFAPEKVPYAIERYTSEAQRLFGVLERRLATHEYLAGAYSIADIASYPWARQHEPLGVNLEASPHTLRWLDAVGARDGVKRGLAVAPPQK